MEQQQTVVFLIRHGQTDTAYVADPELDNVRVLTQQGREQLKKVGEYLGAFAPAAIFYSPRKRTEQSAQVLQEKITAKEGIAADRRLLEIYDAADFASAGERGLNFLLEKVAAYHGQHLVAVSHQDLIEQTLRDLPVTANEADFPCGMAQGYRLVFAGNTFVQCLKINPANA